MGTLLLLTFRFCQPFFDFFFAQPLTICHASPHFNSVEFKFGLDATKLNMSKTTSNLWRSTPNPAFVRGNFHFEKMDT